MARERLVVELTHGEYEALRTVIGNSGDFPDAMEALFPDRRSREKAFDAIAKFDSAEVVRDGGRRQRTQ